MSRLHEGVVILEGITHIEDLPLEKFIDTVENLKDKVVTEKLDGANLWFGVDENGFFTSREGKSKRNARFYTVKDYPMVASYNGFRAAHLALEQVKASILKVLQVGDMVEIEVLFGRQPNTVTYGANGLNYIVILRGIGTDPSKVDKLASRLDDTTVTVKSTVISSPDGDELQFNEENLTWEFTQVKPVDNSKINSGDAIIKLKELKEFLSQKNEAFPSMTNREVAEVKLGSVDKLKRDAMKKEREIVLAKILSSYKLPIKEILLNNFVRKIKPKLQTAELDPSEDVGVEGVVLRDKGSDEQVKLVDKDVFTAMNTFNNIVRGNIAGLVRTDDQDAPIELRGGAFGQAKIRIAQLLGIKELAMSSTSKKTLEKFKGESPEDTAAKLASSINISSFESIKTKIAAILDNALDEVDKVLVTFKAEADNYKLKLKTGKEIGISPEVMKRNLTAFAETKRDIHQIEHAVTDSENPEQLVMALYGRTIQSLFNGSDEVKEAFSLLKKLSEDGDSDMGGDIPAGVPVAPAQTTKDAAIASYPKPLFSTSGRKIEKRKRNFTRRKKFTRPANESLLRIIEAEVANQNATDVDDLTSAQKDIEFKQLRNNVNLGDNVTDQDVNRYLDKAHELNDEVDTVTFGMEMDDGSILKVYVNANQADDFEAALSQMLGQYDDVEEVIDTLANTYDIVDVEWPENYQQAGNQPSEPVDRADNADTMSTVTDTSPSVNPVIDLGSETEENDEHSQSSGEVDPDLGFDATFFSDGDDEPIDDEKKPESDDDKPSADAPDTGTTGGEEESPTSINVDDEEKPTTDDVIGGEVAGGDDSDDESESNDDETDDKQKSKKKDNPPSDDEDEESDDEEADKSKKKEESAMTYGQQFKTKLLEKAAQKKDDKKKKDDEEKDQHLDVQGLPANVEKLLQSFPTKGQKAMIVLLFALGTPVDAMSLKKSDLRKSTDSMGDLYVKDSQFRLWIKRLTDELLKASAVTEAELEDELGNTLQRIIIEIMQKIGMPDSVERLARSTLRTSIRATAKLALSNAKVRQYLKIVAEMLGIDATTGMVKTVKEAATDGRDLAMPVPAEADETGNEWVDEIMKLAAGLGIPANLLDYRRNQTELALKQSRQNMSNYTLVLRNVKKLNQIIGNNTKD